MYWDSLRWSRCRLDNTPRIPLSLASFVCLGRRHALYIPSARLDGSSCSERPQRKSQLCSSPPFRKSRVERWKRQNAPHVGFDAGQRFSKHKVGKRYALSSFSSLQLHLIPITEGELVRWNTDGTLFVVQTLSTLDIYTTVRDFSHPLIPFIHHHRSSRTWP